MLNRMFYTDKFGKTQVYLQKINRLMFENIIQNKRVSDFMPTLHINNYPRSTIDCLVEKLAIKGKYIKDGRKFIKKDILFSVEPWGPQHEDKDHRYYKERVCFYDELKQILYKEGFIDIHIVVKLYKMKPHEYQGFVFGVNLTYYLEKI